MGTVGCVVDPRDRPEGLGRSRAGCLVASGDLPSPGGRGSPPPKGRGEESRANKPSIRLMPRKASGKQTSNLANGSPGHGLQRKRNGLGHKKRPNQRIQACGLAQKGPSRKQDKGKKIESSQRAKGLRGFLPRVGPPGWGAGIRNWCPRGAPRQVAERGHSFDRATFLLQYVAERDQHCLQAGCQSHALGSPVWVDGSSDGAGPIP